MRVKFLLSVLFLAVGLGSIYAQDTLKTDTTKVIIETKKQKTTVSVMGGKLEKRDSTRNASSKFSFQLTFARIDLGLSTFLDNGSFTLSPENAFLENRQWKTSNFGFEVLQTGYRFNSYFKIYLAAGIDWNHIRLKQNITIKPEQPVLTHEPETEVKFSKNRFSSSYLRIPLAFQFRTKDDNKGNKFYFVAGPEVGFLITGKTKQVSDERGKVKFKDDFNLNPFRYGAFARMGYNGLGIYAKYYASDVFADKQGPADFKNFNFGIMLGF